MALALALVGLLPVGLLAYRLVGINREAMERQVELTHTRAATTIASRIESEIATLISLANGLAVNRALSEPRSAPTQDLLRANLAAWSRLGVMGIAVVTPEGEQVILAQLPDEGSRRRVERALGIESDEAVTPVFPPDEPDPVAIDLEETTFDLRVAAPLPGERGFVWLIADGSKIRQAVLDPEQLGREAEVTLAHRSGHPILGSLAAYPPEVLEKAFNPLIEGVQHRFRSADDELIGAYASVLNTEWTVLSRQKLDVAHAVADEMERESWLAVLLVALAIGLISGLTYATVVRPIRQLAAAQRRLAGSSGDAVGSEIDQLQAAFATLEQRLQDRDVIDEVFLGRYQVREVIGSGAMGTVFLGYDPKLQRSVALKTVRLGGSLGGEKRTELLVRLLQEAVLTAKFTHPNIVAVYDVEDRGGMAFIAMEYVDGVSLEKLVWRRQRLSQEDVMVLGAAVASALAAAHADGLVHRDVKPANILLGTDGGIKVTDFGISELLSSTGSDEDVVFGTPGYLPPETLQGKGYDASGDLFSLGSVLYFCLTGNRPFEGKSVKDVIRKTLFGTVTPPSSLIPEISRDLEATVMSLLSSDRSNRPSDAASVAERLERLAAEHQARWRPPPEDLAPDTRELTSPVTQFVPTTRLGR